MPASSKKSKGKEADEKNFLDSYISEGLTEDEVGKKQREYGLNTFESTREIRILRILVSQFKSPLIYILVLAALITIFLRDFVDTAVIGLAVVVNTILGFYQEFKAQKALAALHGLLSPKARVLRNGERQTIEASDIVPGDVCFVGLGERISADGLIVSAEDFSVNEAILTGESAPVHKEVFDFDEIKNFSDLKNGWEQVNELHKAFSGTTVASGEALMVVLAIGSQTEVGKIAKSLQETVEGPTPLQRRIARFSNQLAVFVGVIAVVIFLTGMLVGESFLTIFTTSVAVAVAAIPEGLAVSLTVILAIGMQRILKRRALVRKLVAAETLGSVTVICADKTGTLTKGVMQVTDTDFTDEEKGVRAAVLTNDRRDSLEIAMWNWIVDEKKQDPRQLLDTNLKLDSMPFSPQEKFSAKLYEDGVYVLGAPEVVLSFCKISGSAKQRWMKKIESYGRQGKRIVGLAARERHGNERKISRQRVSRGLEWLGIVIYQDPVRDGVAQALAETKRAGIEVKVITGDYRATAEAVLEQLGILTQQRKLQSAKNLVMDGEELEKLTQDELRGRVEHTVLFARIDPIQKLRIVEALQANGEVVAMTGDGVNDAPALKRSDIGVVVSGATDVAKETADMVLLDDNFSTIVAAVEEGRGIFSNLRKVILYLLSDSFSEVILVLGSLLFGIPLPLTAAQILWINLITDGFPQLALTVEPKDKELMNQPPRSPREPLVDSEIKLLILLISVVTGVFTLAAFYLFWTNYYGGNESLARSIAFAMLGVDSLIYVFSARSLQRPIWETPIFSNTWLVIAVAGGFAFQLIALYAPFLQRFLETHPLSLLEWFVVIFQAFLVIVVVEAVKWWFIKKARLQA